MNTAGAVVLTIVLLLLAAGIGWVIFTRVRASRLGLPPPPLKSYIPFLSPRSSAYAGPTPAPGGLVGWINDRIRLFRHRNTRTATGAYEGTGYSSTRRGGFTHPADDDDDSAWDARVGAYHPYEEERELGVVAGGGQGGGGLAPPPPPDGDAYPMNLAATPTHGEERRGRTRSRSPEPGPGHGQHLNARANPFGDDAEPSNISLRGVSPRPMEASSFAGRMAAAEGQHHDDRRSIFREEV
ncbi:uncharacterized protein THITE_46655 [Thermothielavioides terrestris NRRL 8126]|uniref:Acid phosphatase-like protein n=1 Tax=Thermothielavioides terrestris (strain ATCC 38088 / NRRL 8126) TaxID=578455 RepID=G2RDN1_THETT|nr:uncharacterized protein THITE_46655 [Thermothielavioides terrestris NRRL 8126]AEO70816.1 hypothetical protein THITE_46655 [Thermothielavioides terrestris NRRL 8126]